MKTSKSVALMALGILWIAASPGIQDACAQETNKVGTAAATFLRIPVGARALSMGSSFVSMTDDPTGLFWNPAILPTMQSSAFVADHSDWLPGLTFDFAGIVLPLEGFGTVGFGATILRTDEMQVTTPAQQMGTGETFSASSLALGLTYSRSLTDRFSIGGTFRYIRETIYNCSASGFAFDVGTLYVTPFAGIRLGASISNFGSKLQMQGEDLNVRVDIAPDQEGNNQSVVGRIYTDAFDLPLIMRVGVSGEVFQTDEIRLTLSADGINPNDNAASVNVGGELGLLTEAIRLRAGYRDLFLDKNEFGPTFGLSVNKLNVIGEVSITVDYGFQKFVHLGHSNRFSVTVYF